MQRPTAALLLLLLCRIAVGALPSSTPPSHLTSADEPIVDPAGPNVNVSTILSAVGTPWCMKKCVGRLALAAKKVLSFTNTTDRVRDLCGAYEQTRECLDKRFYCGSRNVYDAVTSGIAQTCVAKRASFDRVEPCLKPHLDGILQNCDASCHVRANLSSISVAPGVQNGVQHSETLKRREVQMAAAMNGNLLMVAKHLPPFCSAVQCIMPCLLQRAEAVCPLSGFLILDSMLQPFDTAAALFAKAPPLMQQLIREQLSDKCTPLFSIDSIARIRKGQF